MDASTTSWYAGRSRNMRTGEPLTSRDATGIDAAAAGKREQLQSAIYSSRSEKGAQEQPIDGTYTENSLGNFTAVAPRSTCVDLGGMGVATAKEGDFPGCGGGVKNAARCHSTAGLQQRQL